ncbi:MAG: exosortase/archaeosortase family protein [Phycisphaerales bacterium]
MNRRRRWNATDLFLALTLATLGVLATREVWADIWRLATRDEENSYVLLAPFVAFWLGWIRRDRLRFVAPSRSLLGPAMIVIGWVLSTQGHRLEVDIAWHFGALLIVLGGALSVLGRDAARAVAPALLALLFLLPTPGTIRQQIAIPLQAASAQAAEYLLDLIGVAVVRDGNLLRINGNEVAVAEACNGMRMVSALALVTFAFVFSTPMRHRIRAVFLVLSPLVALLVNIIRLVPTALFYGYASPATAESFHTASGWIMLVIALGLLWTALEVLRWLEVPLTPYAAPQT